MFTKIAELGLPSYRLKQAEKFYYEEFGSDFSKLTTWPKDLRDKLVQEFGAGLFSETKRLVSKKKDTVKWLLQRTADGQKIETVLMMHKDGRNTVCVSCMVGCPVNCSFCATGKMGFGGNLSADEIVEQVLWAARYLKEQGEGQTVSNVVYMGMGEPMLNLKNVEESIVIFKDKMGMSERRLTVSTSGYVPQFKKFIDHGFRTRMAISLHASNQELRAKLMPVAKIYSLDVLMDALDEYTSITNKRISYEYVMLRGVNDSEENAKELGLLLRNRLAHVNLIPYNAIAEEGFERSGKNKIQAFCDVLERNRIHHSVRVTMGDDVNAACGQLADRENTKNSARKITI